MKKNYLKTIKIIILAIVLTFGIGSTLAWTQAPSSVGNANAVSVPINQSNFNQGKDGKLSVGGQGGAWFTDFTFVSKGSIGISQDLWTGGDIITDSLKGVGSRFVCYDQFGQLIPCTDQTPRVGGGGGVIKNYHDCKILDFEYYGYLYWDTRYCTSGHVTGPGGYDHTLPLARFGSNNDDLVTGFLETDSLSSGTYTLHAKGSSGSDITAIASF